jgi:RNA polymerase sigma-70 factor (ECF subfamily)
MLGEEVGAVPKVQESVAVSPGLERVIEELILTYQHAVYGFALRLAGNQQDAEEIAQDTFVRAYRALPGYSEEQRRTLKTRPWLLQIALNVFRNRVRTRRVPTQPLELDDDDERAPLQFEGDWRERPDAQAEAGEQRRALAAQLGALPLHFRVAVVLRHVEGMAYGEIATVLDQPVGTVKAHVHRGTRLLRTALETQEPELLCEVR